MAAPHEPRAFFGRKRGDKLSPRKAALFDTLLPKVALDLAAKAPGNAAKLFAVPVREVGLEVGFGGAEHLLEQAQTHPDVGWIGSDGFLNAAAKALTGIEEHRLANIRLYHGDAVHLIDWLPAASITRIELLYPDPWPKRRHWKRRFVQHDNLTRLARILKPGGEFRFATDIADYAAWTLAHMQHSPDFVWMAESADDWRKPWKDFSGTRYEAKARREGRAPSYLTFRRR
ncbi:MAG: tRNA (guanosine(46)-N7)-methyltransferase TrmB [Pseudolabrys sp.]|nr:tRNA (guanosine(46)-N7)-methyltransferase TrmB [Pseudolabrys sp.]